MGRPSKYTIAVTDTICALLMEGKPLTSICRLDNMPRYGTVMEWLSKHPSFAEKYARARQVQADYYADEIVEISDTELDPQVAKVRMEARKWHAAHVAPKKWGNIKQEEKDDDAPPPARVIVEVKDARKPSA